MAGSETPASSFRKIRLMLFVLILPVVFLLTGAFLFIRSSQFPRSVGKFISDRSGKTVAIGSITLLPGRKILIQDVIVQEKDSHQPFAVLPATEISVSLSGIMGRRVKAVEFKHPQVTVDLGEKGEEGEEKFSSLPLRVDTITVSEGEVLIRSHDDTTYRMTSVNLEMRRDSDHTAALSGSVYLHQLDTTIPFTTAIDLRTADITRGRVDIFFEDLGTIPLQNKAFFRTVNIKGTARFSLDIERNDNISIGMKGHVAGMGVQRNGKMLLPDNSRGNIRATLAVQEDFSAAELTVHADLASPYGGKEYSHSLNVRGRYEMTGRRATVEKAVVRSSLFGTVQLAGSIDDLPSSSPTMDISIAASGVPLESIQSFFSGRSGAESYARYSHGLARAELSVTGTFRDPHALGIVSGTIEKMSTNTFYLATARAGIPFSYSSGTVRIMNTTIAADEIVYMPEGKGGNPAFRAENCVLRMSHLDLRDNLTGLGGFILNAGKVVIYRNGTALFSDTGITLDGIFKGSRKQQRLQVEHISSASGIMEGFSGSIEMSLGSPVSIQSVLTGERIDLQRIVQKVPFHEKLSDISIQGEGFLRLYSALSVPVGENPRVTGTVDTTILNGGFSSPEFTKVVQGMTMNASAAFSFDLPLQTVEFSLEAQAGGYELLWGRFYGDFKGRDTTLFLRGKYTGGLNTFTVSDSELTMKNIGTVRMSGEIADIYGSARIAADIVLDDIMNNEAFDFFIRETFQEKYNLLSNIATGGVTSGNVSVEGTQERFAVTGRVNIKDMYITEEETGFSAQGVSGFVPVYFLYPEAEFKKDVKLFGLLKARSIDIAGIRLEETEVYPCIWRNTLVFRRDIEVPAFGGSIRLRDFRYTDLFSPGRKLTLSVEIDAIDLRQMSTTLELPVFGGSLTGFIPEAVLSRQRFSTKGRIIIQAFGGEVSIDNLTINNIFGPVASVETSIGIHDLYLDKLTETFEFGHITGVVRGYVKDLLITNGQAERFEAAIESVKKKGVSQWISVEALKKISILGSGTPASVLNQGVYRLFKKYQYAKMGFRGTLKNDVLRLLGVETLGDRWYLVKGGIIPPRVDVISYHQNISFQEMLRRLMRIRSTKGER